MRKGIIFSLDATLALIIIIILAAVFVQQYQAVYEKGSASETLHVAVLDKAIIGLYNGIEGGTDETISNEAEFGECMAVYDLYPDDSDLSNRSKPIKRIFCEEAR